MPVAEHGGINQCQQPHAGRGERDAQIERHRKLARKLIAGAQGFEKKRAAQSCQRAQQDEPRQLRQPREIK